ncbi:MAG: DUF192 domain-containing protein [Patescibacteria group bacterium]
MHGYTKKAHPSDYLLAAFLLALLFWAHSVVAPPMPVSQSRVTIDGTIISVEIARTSEEREKGLSGRSALAERSGMLFAFDHPDRYGFWMQNVHFAIDIVWIGPDWRIVVILENVPPELYPNLFTPTVPAQYVLEVPAGSAERYGWKAGDEVEFDQ